MPRIGQSRGAKDIPVKTEHVAPTIIKNEPYLDSRFLRESKRRSFTPDFECTMTDFIVSSARRVDEQVAKEVEASLRTGIMKNKQTNLFHQQNRANQRLLSTARKTRKETVFQESLSSLQSRVNNEKAARQESLYRQCELAASL